MGAKNIKNELLEVYNRDTMGEPTRIVSISIYKKQHDFIKSNNLNASKIIRDLLDAFIQESEGPPGPSEE